MMSSIYTVVTKKTYLSFVLVMRWRVQGMLYNNEKCQKSIPCSCILYYEDLIKIFKLQTPSTSYPYQCAVVLVLRWLAVGSIFLHTYDVPGTRHRM